MPRSTFDESYFKRFYAGTPVHSRKKIEDLAAAVHSLCSWWDVSIRSVFDVGAGLGYWRDWYASNYPGIEVRSVDVSEHACKKFGHELRDISAWKPARSFDLVVCQSVLQYLPNSQAAAAIDNLAAVTKKVMYLEVPTTRDLKHVVDKRSTDLDIYSRSGDWYRSRLRRHFVHSGAGLWVAKRSNISLYEFERAD